MDQSEVATDVAQDVGGEQPPVESSTTNNQPQGTGAGSNEGPKSAIEAVELALSKPGNDGEGTKQNTASIADQEADGGSPPQGEGRTDVADVELAPIRDPKTASDHRWNRLLKERARALEAATHFSQMQEFARNTGLSVEEIRDAIKLAALRKIDPKAAFEHTRPMVEELQQQLGLSDELPADIQERLDDGRIDEDTARELAQLRAQTQLRERLTKEQQERQEQIAHERATQQTAMAVADTVSKWERDRATKDPDYARKKPFIEAEIHRILQTEGLPDSPEKALAQVKRAYKDVTDRLSSLLPPRPDTTVTTGGTSTSKAIVQPKSAMEAAEAALAGRRVAYS